MNYIYDEWQKHEKEVENIPKTNANKVQITSIFAFFIIVFICFVILSNVGLKPFLYNQAEFKTDSTIEGITTFDDPEYINITSKEPDDREKLDTQSFVDVTDHGAVGDGVTDDHGAIMDAADHAVDNGKDGVIFPSGVYGIGNKLFLDGHYSGLTFYSDSDAVIKTIHENAYRQFEFKADSSGDVEDVAIIGLELDGNKDNLNVDRWGNWGIHLWGDGGIVSGVHLEDLHIHSFSGNGIYINSQDTVVKNCVSEYNWGHGFAVSGDAKDVVITNITSRYNVSPDNPLHGSGMDIRGGDNIVVSNFTFENNGFGMKTSIYEPKATITNGLVVGNNGVGVRLVQAPKEIYIDNVETRENGREGFTMRHGGTVHMGKVTSINDGQGSNHDGALYIADEMDEVHIEDLTVKNFPGYGINSYTSLVTIEKLDISGCDNSAINPRSGTIVIRPPDLEESYYTIHERFNHDPFRVDSDGVVINGEKLRAQSENGEVEINLDDWTSNDRRFTASSEDTVIFEFEGLKPYTSYEIYDNGDLSKYVSTDSEGYLAFEHDDCSGDVLIIQEGGVNVVTKEPTDITSNSAVLNGEILDMDGHSELEVYFRYRKRGNEEWYETTSQSITSIQEYDETLTNISPDTEYEYKVFGQCDGKEIVGQTESFTTSDEKISIDISLSTDSKSDGWNFISFNLIPNDPSLSLILNDPSYGIEGSYDRVMYHDASVDEWYSYVPGREDRFNDVDSWDYTMGVWIRMTSDDTLTVEGSEPVQTTIELKPGWNMVGLPSSTNGNHNLPTEIDKVGYFDAIAEYNLEYCYEPEKFIFEVNNAYWVHNPTDKNLSWTIEY